MKMKFFAFITALAIVLSCMPVSAVYLPNDTIAGLTVTKAETHVLGDGLTYNEFSYTDSRGMEQTCFTMQFNPTTSDFRTYVYHTRASHGATIVEDVASAQREGLEVYGAINGDFFSMQGNYGTPIGMYVTEGKLVVAEPGLAQYNLVIDEDGKADVVFSKLGYGLTIGETNYSTNLAALNKRAETYRTNGIYYFDRDIGIVTPTSGTKTEIVCDITENVLSVGKTLKGTVKEIRTTGGGSIGENQFVLSVGSAVDVSTVTVGAEVCLEVVELTESSKEAMNNAYHAIYAHQALKVDGVDRVANGEINDPGLANQYAQRSVFGIKEDGTIIYLTCDGRKSSGALSNGWDYTMLMEMMEPFDCRDIINFDGGYSTAVVIGERDGKHSYEFISAAENTGRAVGNSILIVRDPNAAPLEEETYEPIVDKPDTELRNVAINKSYSIIQYGHTDPNYLSTIQGDSTGRKLTNGKYRNEENSGDALSMACMGTSIQLHVVMDLEQARDDLRSVVWRGVGSTGNYSFRSDNVLVYTSDDGVNWGHSIAGEVTGVAGAVSGVKDYTYSFKEAQSGRYLKLVFGNTSNFISLDEIEVMAMVDKSEPVEEPLPEDENDMPAEDPDESYENVALGQSYTVTCDGQAIQDAFASTEPRYYDLITAETNPQKLTNGKLGTGGNYSDGATLGLRVGVGKNIEIILDLSEVKEGIEFVQLLHIIDNNASFGKITSADISYSTDGEEYTLADCRLNASLVSNTYYNDLTFQFKEAVDARYIKVNFLTPTFLFGAGELTVFAPAEEEEISDPSGDDTSDDTSDNNSSEDVTVTYGDVNGDGNVNSLDAAQVLKFDAMLIALSEDALLAADVNGSGEVDSLDAAQILKFDAMIIDIFPIEQ